MSPMLLELLLLPVKSYTRITSFVGKELTEVIRQPGALFTLVLAPFVIMALFGVGYSGQRRPLKTVIVLPTDTALPRDAETYQQLGGPAVEIVEIAPEPEGPR